MKKTSSTLRLLATVCCIIICVIMTGSPDVWALEPHVEAVKILDGQDRDLTPESAWPTLHEGDSLTVYAVVYPYEFLDSEVEWSCWDKSWAPYPIEYNADGTVTVRCLSTELEELRLTASCDGVSATIYIYLREDDESENISSAAQDVYKIWIVDETGKNITSYADSPSLHAGESITLKAEFLPSEVTDPELTWSCSDNNGRSVQLTHNDDGSMTVTCLNASERSAVVSVESGNAWSYTIINLTDDTGGKLVITDQVLIKPEVGDRSAYYFARIENVSDAPVKTRWGDLTGWYGDEIVVEEHYVAPVPDDIVLNPGEHAYFAESLYDRRLEGVEITAYEFTESLNDYSDGRYYDIIPSEAEYRTDEDGYGFIRFILSNNGDQILYPSYFTCALFDEDDNLVFVTGLEIDGSLGIYPSGTVSIDDYLQRDILVYYQENGIVPTRAESILYLEKEE